MREMTVRLDVAANDFLQVHKLEEIDGKLAASEKAHSQADRDTRAFLEAELEKQKLYVDHGVEGVRTMQEAEGEKGRGRVAELAETLNQLESNLAEVRCSETC